MIYRNIEPLVEKIYEQLQDNAYMMVYAGNSTSSHPLIPNLEENPKAAICNYTADANPTDPTEILERCVESYKSKQTDPMRKIIEVIVKETMDYMMKNAELTAAERYDQLETDFNKVIAALDVFATTMKSNTVTAAIGTAMDLVVTAGGGLTRAVTTTAAMKLENETNPTPTGDRIYIK